MTPSDRKEFEGAALFRNLSPEVRDCLAKKAVVRDYPRGSTIGLQGDEACSLKLILSGWVKLYRVASNGEEAILETLDRGQSFDELAALDGAESSSSAEALTDVRLLHLDLQAICQCDRARSEIHAVVLRAAAAHLHKLTNQVEQLKIRTTTDRLVGFLAELSATHQDADEIELPYGKVALAGKLGMKPESLSRAFAKLKSIGIVSDLRRVIIADRKAFHAYRQQAGF
ncbi:Crp/Fnr family transcriptional regulator [Thalassococcus sp. CAU 1522]|uniref:Crp/Fnr family transcriptional regulator n=1 Tax=Thalassococcus arenae TaxID=2851652 RepID=A0ABS6N3V7_9RHOB|nr:Crp/Fnr family transcriptional regulator [Thalassococcus arenae]MBV2358705.1 Crp/Fnr family transcriptional regulator [Thalassococcus arenae]